MLMISWSVTGLWSGLTLIHRGQATTSTACQLLGQTSRGHYYGLLQLLVAVEYVQVMPVFGSV